jgi:hypothetical protein
LAITFGLCVPTNHELLLLRKLNFNQAPLSCAIPIDMNSLWFRENPN